jgi:hypothetical protein
VYVDGDLSVTGTENGSDSWEDDGVTYMETWTVKYSANLKKGWNLIYRKETEIGNTYIEEITTTAPTGIKWHFES